jgi:predicted RNase H-like HicB family nuclease
LKDRYIFPALFCYYPNKSIGVVFPDLNGCVSQGNDEADALRMAREALTLHLWGMEEDEEDIPEPSAAKNLRPGQEQVIVLIDAYMPPFRERMNNKAVTKAVTVPRWLEIEAKSAKLNYSQILQDGLIQRLGIERKTPVRRTKSREGHRLDRDGDHSSPQRP